MDGLLSSTGFNQYNIPGAKALNGDNSAVRVAVALNSGGNRPSPWDGPTQADGGFPAILAFNEIGDYIGASDWEHRPKIESGGFEDVVVHQEALGPSQQPTYLQFFAGNDAICVAYISQVWPDGQSRGWLGDIGHACGRDWYYSHITVGNDHHSPGEFLSVGFLNCPFHATQNKIR